MVEMQGDETGFDAGAAPDLDRVDALADEITLLAGQIAAATARFLRLLAEFDDLGCWGGVGIRSLAHWLSFRAGMSLRTARDHVRVARALKGLPVTVAAFEAGELSFSKVRALTRVATGATEGSLVAVAKNSPAAHVERLVAGLRKVRPADPAWQRGNASPPAPDPGQDGDPQPEAEPGPRPEPEPEPERVPPRTMQWRWDEDTGELVVWGRFGAADGRVLLAALTRAELERVRTTVHEEPAGPPDEDDRSGARSEAVDRTAPPPSDAGPALVALAGIGLAAQEAPVHAPAAEVVYLHRAADDGSAEHPGAGPGTGVVSADDGPALEPDAGHEVMCGSRSRCVLERSDGAVLAYGRSRRLFSATQLKALRLRDRSCRTPGCQRTRFLHAHHVVPWWEGGPTDLDNAILLCSSCHRAVHLGRLRVRTAGGQVFEFVDVRTGRRLDAAPPMFGRADHILENRTITPTTVTGGWWGEPLDLSLATATLVEQWRVQAQRLRHPWDDPTPPWGGPGEGLGQEAA